MQYFNKEVAGPLTLDQDLDFHGMVLGSLTIPSGRSVKMHGTVDGDLIVEKGGQAHVAGTVNGAVINQGGNVTIEGVVRAVRDLDPEHPTLVAANAVVRPL